MLQIEKAPALAQSEFEPEPSPAELLTGFVDLVRRQLPLIVIVVACTVAFGLVYLVTSPALYTATGTMVIDTRKVQLFQQQSVLGDIAIDTGTVETQVQILRSENISLAVIKDLRLTEDPEFVGPGGGLVGAVVEFIGSLLGNEETKSEFELTRMALERFENNRSIKRLGLTYAMEVSFRSLSPDKAATIANAIADAYIVDQLEAKYQATKRASLWLQDRIKELRTQASAAERAVIEYKEQNNIVDTGGRLITEQQLAEVNSQLILARAATAESKARLDRINDILKEEIPNESVTDALKNETIIKLRGQYVDIAAREATWSQRYGRNHLAAINLRNQMQEIRRNISQELARIQQAYQSDYDIARAREESIKNSLANVVSEAQTTNQAQVQLRELESNAQTYRAMYDSFLQRYMEAIQQQSFPITEARLISPASRPLKKSDPKALVVLAVSFTSGLVLAFGSAYLRELGDRVFRTSSQVEDVLRVNCLAVMPALKLAKTQRRHGDVASVTDGGLSRDDPLMAHVVDEPLSRFAEAVRSLKVAADVNGVVKSNAVIGITSAMPGEGKSTIASNFAQLIAHAGGRVLLIDADLRNPSVTRVLAPGPRPGLVEVVAGRAAIENVLVRDATTGLVFLPAGTTSKLLHTNEILSSAAMRRVVDEARTEYDYVVIDFPPLAPVVDVRVTTAIVDSYIFVIEWGQTRIDVVTHALSNARPIYDRLLGVVLNKADTREIGRYEHYHGHYYYQKHYARYGYAE